MNIKIKIHMHEYEFQTFFMFLQLKTKINIWSLLVLQMILQKSASRLKRIYKFYKKIKTGIAKTRTELE